ncbi:MAG: DUF5011 domain-containing protein [Solobacterium sp.]|nr:DUF5011 domain-containing protein [Solobacterium sp.]
MWFEQKKNRHSFMMGGICALMLFAGTRTGSVLAAEEPADEFLPTDSGLVEISQQEADPLSVLKRAVIEIKADMDDTVILEDINIDASRIETFGFDRNQTGLQNVTVRISLSQGENGISELCSSFEETVPVRMVKSSAPTIRLKSDTVVVNNGDIWNAASYLAYINDDSGILPALKISGDIDITKDGDYTVTYTAVDTEGGSSTAVLNVLVRTHEEVIRVREEAERKAREAAAAAKKKAEEEKKKLLTASVSFSAPSGKALQGSGNPYRGGWSNCTWGAWQLVYANSGVKLPNFHNAYSWLTYAKAAGYSTGGTPKVGSVAVYKRHVAYVAKVSEDGSMVYIKEGGHNGKYNERWVSATAGIPTQFLRGYIYIKP